MQPWHVETPWGLTDAEIRLLDALLETDGCVKMAARAICRSPATIERHVDAIRKRMDALPGRNSHVIRWAKYRHGKITAPMSERRRPGRPSNKPRSTNVQTHALSVA